MSGAKSILEIDLKDEKWKTFNEEFKKYSSALSDMPAGWGSVSQAIQGASGEFHELVRSAQLTAAATLATAANQERLLLALDASSTSGERLERTFKSVHGHITDSTLSLLKWTGIMGGVSTLAGGLLGAGGLWGLDRLASSASALGRRSSGLGVTAGEQQAFGVNYGRGLDDPNGFLGNLADAKSDQNKWAIFSSLGIKNFQNRDAADLAPDVLASARHIYQQNPTAAWAHARGLDQLLDMTNLRRIGGMSDKDFDGMNRGFQKDRKDLDVAPGALSEWQKFTTQMQRAEATIEKTFITGLVGLAPQLTALSANFTDLAAAFLKSPQVKEGLEDLASGLETVAHWFKAGKFPWNDTDKVPIDPKVEAEHPTGLGKWLYDSFDRLRGIDNWLSGGGSGGVAPGKQAWTGQDQSYNAWLRAGHDPTAVKSPSQMAFGVETGDRAQFAKDYFVKQGNTEAGAAALVGMLFADTKLDPNAFNPAGGGQGAQGIAGWRGGRIDKFQELYGHPLKGAPFDEQLAYVEWELEHTEKASGAIARSANHAPTASRDLVHAFERPGKDDSAEQSRAEMWAKSYGNAILPTKPARVTVEVKNVVQNNTGGSAIISGSQASVR